MRHHGEEQPPGRIGGMGPKRDRLPDEMIGYCAKQEPGTHESSFAQLLRYSDKLSQQYENAVRAGDADEIQSVWSEILEYERQRLREWKGRLKAA